MNINKKSQNNNHNVKKRLLEAGIALFAEKGYASTSVREITARAGVTKPVLYYYFQNKEGIFRAILDGAAQQQKDILQQVLQMSGTALERLILLHRRIYEAIMENKSLFKFIHNLVFGPPQGVPAYDFERYHRLMVETIKAIYREGVNKGEVREAPLDEVAFLVQGVLDFCFHMDYVYPNNSDPDRPERLLKLAFKGLAHEVDEFSCGL